MKISSVLLGLITVAFVLCFALPNQLPVSLGMWPFEGTIEVPLYSVGLVPLACGLILGGLLGWLLSIPHRLRARRLSKELGALNEKIGTLQKSAIIQEARIEPQTSFWKRKL